MASNPWTYVLMVPPTGMGRVFVSEAKNPSARRGGLRFKRISLRHHTSDFRRCFLEEELPYLGTGSGAFALYYHYTTICGFVKPLSYYRLVCVPRYSIYIGVDG